MASVTNTIEFACTCGQKVRARVDQGGKLFRCTACGSQVHVPRVSISQIAHAATQADLQSTEDGVPATFTQLMLMLAGAWLSVVVLGAICWMFSTAACIALIVGASFVFGYQIWNLLLARQRVLTKKNVGILWNMVRLIAWDPIEGILVLRNKSVSFCDDNLADAAGGIRLVYSILGEELALRAPLEIQTLSFRDENVLTREYLSVTIRGTMKWRINDLQKFYLLVSRELRSTTNRDDREAVSASTRSNVSSDGNADAAIRQLLRAAIAWMQVLVEEESRNVVSRARSGLLIADKLSQELFPQPADPLAPQQRGELPTHMDGSTWSGAADGLAGAIHDTIARRLEPYGIAVEDVSLQEIRLPEEVMRECIEACRAFYLPTIAHRKASEIRENLQAQADVIGVDALATKEVVGAAPAFTLPDFLTNYLQKRSFGAKPKSLPSNQSDAWALAAINETGVAKKKKKPKRPAEGDSN